MPLHRGSVQLRRYRECLCLAQESSSTHRRSVPLLAGFLKRDAAGMPYVIDSVMVYCHKLPRTDGSARDESLNSGKILGLPFRACDMDSVAQSNWHSRF